MNVNENEQNELHRSIWSIVDDLRGAVDGWDFKSYILGIMFYRYVSENLADYINKNEHEAGNTDFDYSKMSHQDAEPARKDLVKEKGFFILPSELFCNVTARAENDGNLNETLEKVFNHIEESARGTSSEDDFAGLFDDIDVNSNKLGPTVEKRNKKLALILSKISEMKLGDYQSSKIDAIIQLPDNLFFGTTIATCIMVMKKPKSDTNIVFIDASKEYQKVTNYSKLSNDNIMNILNAYQERKDKQYIVKVASYEDVKNNDSNLSVSTYVEKEDTREKIDIKALNDRIDGIVENENKLREEIEKIILEIGE